MTVIFLCPIQTAAVMSRNRNSRARRARVIYLHVPRYIQEVTVEVQTLSPGLPKASTAQSPSTQPVLAPVTPCIPCSIIDDFDGIYLDGDEF